MVLFDDTVLSTTAPDFRLVSTYTPIISLVMRSWLLFVVNELLVHFFRYEKHEVFPIDHTTALKSVFMLTTMLCAVDYLVFASNTLGASVMQVFPVGVMLCFKRAPVLSACKDWSPFICSLVVDIAWALLSNLYVGNLVYRIIRKRASHTLNFFLLFCIHIISSCNEHTVADFVIRIPCFYASAAIVNFAPIFLVTETPNIPPHMTLAVSAHLLFAQPYVAVASCLTLIGLAVRIYIPTAVMKKTNEKRETVQLSHTETDEEMLRQQLRMAKALQSDA